MGSGKMGYWSIGKIPLDREAIKCMSFLFKPTFPGPDLAFKA